LDLHGLLARRHLRAVCLLFHHSAIGPCGTARTSNLPHVARALYR
jgi:hypothetical protein